MLFLTESDVRRLLSIPQAISLMRRAFDALAAGTAENQPRRRLMLPTGSVLHSLAGADGRYFGTKVYSTHVRHGAHFLFLLYDAATARPLALFEANWLGQIRTGAASGFATEVLARPDAGVLGVIGTGFQARSQVEAVAAVRSLTSVKVWSRDAARREAFARECREHFGLPASAAETAEAAVRDSALVVTATYAKDPVLEAAWISPGTHVNAAGSNQPQRRELPSDLLARADRIVVDSLEVARIEAGDLLLGLADWSHVAELKNYASWEARPRDAVTIFKSNGLGVEDVAAAGWVYEQARERGMGSELPILAE